MTFPIISNSYWYCSYDAIFSWECRRRSQSIPKECHAQEKCPWIWCHQSWWSLATASQCIAMVTTHLGYFAINVSKTFIVIGIVDEEKCTTHELFHDFNLPDVRHLAWKSTGSFSHACLSPRKRSVYPRIWNRLSSLHNHQDVYYINKLLFMRVGKEERNNSVKSFQKK